MHKQSVAERNSDMQRIAENLSLSGDSTEGKGRCTYIVLWEKVYKCSATVSVYKHDGVTLIFLHL